MLQPGEPTGPTGGRSRGVCAFPASASSSDERAAGKAFEVCAQQQQQASRTQAHSWSVHRRCVCVCVCVCVWLLSCCITFRLHTAEAAPTLSSESVC